MEGMVQLPKAGGKERRKKREKGFELPLSSFSYLGRLREEGILAG